MNKYIISATFYCKKLEINKFAIEIYKFSYDVLVDTTYNNSEKYHNSRILMCLLFFQKDEWRELKYHLVEQKTICKIIDNFLLIISDTIPKKSIYKTNTAKMYIFKNHLKKNLGPKRCVFPIKPDRSQFYAPTLILYTTFGLQL